MLQAIWVESMCEFGLVAPDGVLHREGFVDDDADWTWCGLHAGRGWTMAVNGAPDEHLAVCDPCHNCFPAGVDPDDMFSDERSCQHVRAGEAGGPILDPLWAEELQEQVRRIAAQAHAGQRDKAGRPYLDHARRVADRLPWRTEKAVAFLHDVLEDSDWTVEDLRARRIPPYVIALVEVLSKREGESHVDAVRRACAHHMARTVKRADVLDNADPDRLALLEPEQAHRLGEKYALALRILDGDLPAGGLVVVIDDLRRLRHADAVYARTSRRRPPMWPRRQTAASSAIAHPPSACARYRTLQSQTNTAENAPCAARYPNGSSVPTNADTPSGAHRFGPARRSQMP